MSPTLGTVRWPSLARFLVMVRTPLENVVPVRCRTPSPATDWRVAPFEGKAAPVKTRLSSPEAAKCAENDRFGVTLTQKSGCIPRRVRPMLLQDLRRGAGNPRATTAWAACPQCAGLTVFQRLPPTMQTHLRNVVRPADLQDALTLVGVSHGRFDLSVQRLVIELPA